MRATPAEQERLRATGLPVVLVGSPTPGFDSVGIDDIAAARIAAELLLARLDGAAPDADPWTLHTRLVPRGSTGPAPATRRARSQR